MKYFCNGTFNDFKPICFTVLLCLLAGTSSYAEPQDVSLHQHFDGDFLIGTALNERQISGADVASHEFLAHHFNAVTAENAMKWQRLQPREGEYFWDHADALVAFANENDIHLTGHTLIWHRQTPDWVFQDSSGRPASRELLLRRMKAHIEAVMGRYKGRVQSWDVVNEVVEEDGTLRNSQWRKLIGDDFICKAYQFARAADPDAKLYYNDYNLFKPSKRDGVIRLLRKLQEDGVNVDGVGMQAHYSLSNPANLNDVEDSIIAFANEELDVLITELDVSVLETPQGDDNINGRYPYDPNYDPYRNGLPADVEQTLNDRYAALMRIFLRNRDKISRVTFWGVHDAQSWKNNWPMTGRSDYPLVFDRNGRPKSVLARLLELQD